MRRLFVVAMFAAVLPVATEAQQRGRTQRVYVVDRDDCCYSNRFSLDPYAGAIKDAYDVGANDDFGLLLGFRVTYRLGSRTRMLGNFGYSNTENVSNPGPITNYYIYDNVWLITTGGAEFDIVPGNTSASLGLQMGAGWRRLDVEGTVGSPITPPLDDDSFEAFELLMPSVTLRQRLWSRATAMLALQDHMFGVFSGTTQHSPALTLGVAFR